MLFSAAETKSSQSGSALTWRSQPASGLDLAGRSKGGCCSRASITSITNWKERFLSLQTKTDFYQNESIYLNSDLLINKQTRLLLEITYSGICVQAMQRCGLLPHISQSPHLLQMTFTALQRARQASQNRSARLERQHFHTNKCQI